MLLLCSASVSVRLKLFKSYHTVQTGVEILGTITHPEIILLWGIYSSKWRKQRAGGETEAQPGLWVLSKSTAELETLLWLVSSWFSSPSSSALKVKALVIHLQTLFHRLAVSWLAGPMGSILAWQGHNSILPTGLRREHFVLRETMQPAPSGSFLLE